MKPSKNNSHISSRIENVGRTLATVGLTTLALGAGLGITDGVRADNARNMAVSAEDSGDPSSAMIAYTESSVHSANVAEEWVMAIGGALLTTAGVSVTLLYKKR